MIKARAMVRDIRLYGAVMVGLITIQALVAAPASPIAPCQAPPLPAPSGNVVTVSTEPDLQRAVANTTAGQTIVIQPGTYNLATGGGTLYFHKLVDSVTIRGATNNCDDVMLLGAGMTTQGNTPYGIWVGGPNNLLIANLQIRGVYYSPIQLDPNYGGTQSPRVYNVHLVDAGEQFIKVNPQSNLAGGVVNTPDRLGGPELGSSSIQSSSTRRRPLSGRMGRARPRPVFTPMASMSTWGQAGSSGTTCSGTSRLRVAPGLPVPPCCCGTARPTWWWRAISS